MTDNAAEILKQLIDSPSIPDLQRHLTCGPCVLLDWAVRNQRDGSTSSVEFIDLMQELKANLDVLRPSLRTVYTDPASNKSKVHLDCFPQLQARFNLIETALGDGDVESAITELVRATGKAWKHETQSYVQSFETAVGGPGLKPGSRLLPSFMPFVGSSGIRKNIEDVAANVGWSHPGLLLAGEILASLFGDQRKPDVTVHTKIMFAADHPEHPQGILADVMIERLPGGCGLLIPDAAHCGYLSMHSSFSKGLQNALWAARNYAMHHFDGCLHEFDWRWSMDLLRPVQSISNAEVQLKLAGPSAEVALACGLIAAYGSNPDNRDGIDPLDPHVGATASIGHPGEKDVDLLKGVASIDVKTLVGPMETRRLMQIVVASDQDPKWIPKDPRFEFPAASSLAKAYEAMTRFPRLTRGVNRHLAAKATQLADERCTPYILPEIAEVLPGREPNSRSGKKKESLRTLTDLELQQLTTGQLLKSAATQDEIEDGKEQSTPWVGNRVRIFADSGLGKSMFILRCEAAIAQSGLNLLPLRIGRCTGNDGSIAEITRTGTGDVLQVSDRLADLPSVTQASDAFACEQPLPNWVISSEQRKEWLRWMIKHGRVVFLLDAVDQIDDSINGLGMFLGSGDVSKCPVIITGRPESLEGREQAWYGNDWKTLRLKPFDQERQRKYLCDSLSDELIPTTEQVNWNTKPDELRRHQWKDLLEVPLLLSLLKQLATSPEETQSLKSIHSRYDLYDRAVRQLITKGWETVEKDDEKKLLQSGKRVREVLGIVSWFMVTSHDFTGILQGDDYAALGNSELLASNADGTKVLEALQQIDLTTAFQVLDDLGPSGLSFRHRSFMEFFAGCHLMDRYKTVDRATGRRIDTDRVSAMDRQQMLHEVHDTLDDQGHLLPHMLTDRANRPADWHDTLRFALSHAQSNARDELALQLIELGNPWVVAESMKRDDTKFGHRVECLAAWLVHGDYPNWFDYQHALNWVHQKSDTDVQAEARALVASSRDLIFNMTSRSTRDAACLGTLRQLLPDPASLYVGLSAEAKLLDQLKHLPSNDGHWNFLESFVPVRSGVFDLSEYPEHSEIRPQQKSIRAFALADFRVTNAAFEVFCPSHRRRRDQYSQSNDQPVIHVNLHMATEYCEWLSMLTGKTYRLPTEWEWEWACRWHNTRKQTFWWGPEINDRLCWYGGVSVMVQRSQRNEHAVAMKRSQRLRLQASGIRAATRVLSQVYWTCLAMSLNGAKIVTTRTTKLLGLLVFCGAVPGTTSRSTAIPVTVPSSRRSIVASSSGFGCVWSSSLQSSSWLLWYRCDSVLCPLAIPLLRFFFPVRSDAVTAREFEKSGERLGVSPPRHAISSALSPSQFTGIEPATKCRGTLLPVSPTRVFKSNAFPGCDKTSGLLHCPYLFVILRKSPSQAQFAKKHTSNRRAVAVIKVCPPCLVRHTHIRPAQHPLPGQPLPLPASRVEPPNRGLIDTAMIRRDTKSEEVDTKVCAAHDGFVWMESQSEFSQSG